MFYLEIVTSTVFFFFHEKASCFLWKPRLDLLWHGNECFQRWGSYIFLSSSQDHRSQHVGCDQGKTSEWLGGFIHGLPSELHASFIPGGLCGAALKPADLEIWTVASSGFLKLSQCAHGPVCLGSLYKIYNRSCSVCFHLVFYGLCPQCGQSGQSKDKHLFFLELYWTWHATAQNLKLETLECVCWRWEIYPTRIKNDLSTCQKSYIPQELNMLLHSEKSSLFSTLAEPRLMILQH